MHRIILMLTLTATVFSAATVRAQHGRSPKVTHKAIYSVGIDSRNIYLESTSESNNGSADGSNDDLRTLKYFYDPAFVPQRCEDGSFAWRVKHSVPTGKLRLRLKIDLFNEHYATLATEVIGKSEQRKFSMLPFPIKECSFLLADGETLPDGVELIERATIQPGNFVWLEFEADASTWPHERRPQLLEILTALNLVKLVQFNALQLKSNEVTIVLRTDAAAKIRRDLDGDSLPHRSGVRLVSRQGFRDFQNRVRQSMEINALILEPGKFDLQLAERIAATLKAESISIDQQKFLQLMNEVDYHPDDLRADVLVREYNASKDRAAEEINIQTEHGVGGAAGFAGFSASASSTEAKADFREFAKERGVVGEWQGQTFSPRAIRLQQVNISKLDTLRVVRMKTTYATEELFVEFQSYQLSNFDEGDGAFGAISSLRAAGDALREQTKIMQGTIQTLNDRLSAAQLQIKALEKQLLPKPARRSVCRVSHTFRDNTTGATSATSLVRCWPLRQVNKKMDPKMGSEKNDAKVRLTSRLVIVREGGRDHIELRASFYCQEQGGDWTCFQGEVSRRIFTANRGERITGVKEGYGRFDTGTQTLKRVKKRVGQWSIGNLYGWQRFPEGYAPSFWKNLEVHVDNDWKSYSRVGVRGTVEFTAILEGN